MHVMARAPSLAILAALCGTVLGGCDSAPTDPAAPAPVPRLDFSNGPGELPNVIRFGENFLSHYVYDTERGLFVIQGLPADVTDFFVCEGGTVYLAQTLNTQYSGMRKGVVHALWHGEDINFHVWRVPSDFDPTDFGRLLPLLCTVPPLAVGTGRVVAQHSDYFQAAEHTSSTKVSFTGTLTDLQTGERLRLAANSHELWVGATRVRAENRVRLHPLPG